MKLLKNKKGQGLIEYLILVALIAVATIAIVRVMGQTVSARFATVTYALQGKKKDVTMSSIDSTYHAKKDLGDFISGVSESSKQ